VIDVFSAGAALLRFHFIRYRLLFDATFSSLAFFISVLFLYSVFIRHFLDILPC
jgi:hypothetical protein